VASSATVSASTIIAFLSDSSVGSQGMLQPATASGGSHVAGALAPGVPSGPIFEFGSFALDFPAPAPSATPPVLSPTVTGHGGLFVDDGSVVPGAIYIISSS
jgi:hypothetical protein